MTIEDLDKRLAKINKHYRAFMIPDDSTLTVAYWSDVIKTKIISFDTSATDLVKCFKVNRDTICKDIDEIVATVAQAFVDAAEE